MEKPMDNSDEGLLESIQENNQRPLTRRERRDKTRYFAKMFKKHIAAKPSVDISEMDEEAQGNKIFEMQRWATRYGILLRKLTELGYDFEKDGLGIHAAQAREAQAHAAQLKVQGSTEVGDLQIVPDPK